jgi:hypothetical protein
MTDIKQVRKRTLRSGKFDFISGFCQKIKKILKKLDFSAKKFSKTMDFFFNI